MKNTLEELHYKLSEEIVKLNNFIIPEDNKEHKYWVQCDHLSSHCDKHLDSYFREITSWYVMMETKVIPKIKKCVMKVVTSRTERFILGVDQSYCDMFIPSDVSPELFMNREVCRRLLGTYEDVDGAILEDKWGEVTDIELKEVIKCIRLSCDYPISIRTAKVKLYDNNVKITKRNHYRRLLDHLQKMIDRQVMLDEIGHCHCCKFNDEDLQCISDIKWLLTKED